MCATHRYSSTAATTAFAAAGLLCGLWWEAWNYGAAAKWVYTLPVLNFGKIFEMPVLGYLGFPPFALECAVMYNFMRALDERVLVTARRCRYAILIQLAFWLVMLAGTLLPSNITQSCLRFLAGNWGL